MTARHQDGSIAMGKEPRREQPFSSKMQRATKHSPRARLINRKEKGGGGQGIYASPTFGNLLCIRVAHSCVRAVDHVLRVPSCLCLCIPTAWVVKGEGSVDIHTFNND